MDRLLPKNDYFKHTTRVVLRESEKQQIFEAVKRAEQYLSRMCSGRETAINGSVDRHMSLRHIRNHLVYLGRWVTLRKGSTQPRRLYRHARRSAVTLEANRIATETGADYTEVRRLFMILVDKYVSEEN